MSAGKSTGQTKRGSTSDVLYLVAPIRETWLTKLFLEKKEDIWKRLELPRPNSQSQSLTVLPTSGNT